MPAVVLMALACDQEPPTGPELKSTNAAPLAVSPRSLAFTIPPTTTATLTASVQFTGLITARTSNAACATVTPLSAPATKPQGSPLYIATFTVTPAGGGSCTIAVTDKQGRTVVVPVAVSVDPVAHIVFQSEQDDPEIEIYMVGTGSTPLRLTNTAGGNALPNLSPDRTKIAFTSTRDDARGDIYVMAADGSGVVRLAPNTARDAGPIFSPDGSKIAFYSTREDDDDEVYIMNADGTSPRRLTVNVGHGDYPSGFSPDGTRLLVSSVDDQVSIFYAIDVADGGNRAVVGRGYSAKFSPDGAHIVFGSDADIYLADADGSNVTRLTQDGYFNYDPVFSPDGDRIVFAHGFPSHLYTMKPDGSSVVQLTNGAWDGYPDWR